MPEEPNPPNFAAMFSGVRVTSIQAERQETPDERPHRQKKDFISFLVKDISSLVIAFAFVVVIGVYCCCVVAKFGVNSSEANRVLPLLTSLFGGVVGMAFGKLTK